MSGSTAGVEVALGPGASLGEGPVWDQREGRLVWVDIDRGVVHLSRPHSGDELAVELGQPVGFAVPRASGGLVVAMRDGIASLELDSNGLELLVGVERGLEGNRMNDGACDGRGRLWAGTMSTSHEPGAGALYRLDPDLYIEPVIRAVSVSNGVGWSPDERLMYFVDTPLCRVDVFDFDPDAGKLSARRPFVEVPAAEGSPDGLTVDKEGGVWIALWGGGAVHRYRPDGQLDRRLTLPVSQVTSCCFGDADLSTLYITSAARGLDGSEALAGAVFAARPGVTGLPSTPFGG